MIQKIKLQTNGEVREYKFLPDAAAFQAAACTGEIAVREEVVYREFIVLVLEDFEMLILDRIGGIPQFFNQPFQGGAGGADWKFTVDPSQFMKG